MKLIIPRDKWLRGEGGDDSYLLREEDQMQCCVGFYLEACGIARDDLVGVRTAQKIPFPLPNECRWLVENLDKEPTPSFHASRLYQLNDDNREMYIHTREEHIKYIFLSMGVEVQFVN
jgi:hypothetical protein